MYYYNTVTPRARNFAQSFLIHNSAWDVDDPVPKSDLHSTMIGTNGWLLGKLSTVSLRVEHEKEREREGERERFNTVTVSETQFN